MGERTVGFGCVIVDCRESGMRMGGGGVYAHGPFFPAWGTWRDRGTIGGVEKMVRIKGSELQS